MKATKFLLLLWALALGSTVGWAQSVTQPTLQLSNPSGTDATDVAVCPTGGSTVTLNWFATDVNNVRLELRSANPTGALVTSFYPGSAGGMGVTDNSNGLIEPLSAISVMGMTNNVATVTLPALNVGTKYYLVVIGEKTVGMVTTSQEKWVSLDPVALPASPAFTFTPTAPQGYPQPGALVCVQPNNAAIATAISPDTDKFGYTWSLVEGVQSTVSGSPVPTEGTSTTITPTAAFGTAAVKLIATYRSMSCGNTSTTQTLSTTAAIVPKISNGGAAGINVVSPAIFNSVAPYGATALFTPKADNEVCEGTPIMLSVHCETPNQVAVWFTNNTKIGEGSPITVVPTSNDGNAYHEFTYTAKCKLAGSVNCESEGRSITVKTIRQSSLVPNPTALTGTTCQLPSDWIGTDMISITKTANCPTGSVANWYDNEMEPLKTAGGTPDATGNTWTRTINRKNAGTTTWYVTCQQGLCESESKASASYTVTAIPNLPVITNTNGDVACANTASGPIPGPTSLILTALCDPGTTANWYVSASTVPGFVFTAPTGNPTVGIVGTGGSYTHAGAAGTTTYRVRCKGDDPNGCWSELSAPRTITINAVATVTGALKWTSTQTSQICMDLSTQGTLAAVDFSGLTCAHTLKWYHATDDVVVPAPTLLSIAGPVNPGPNPDGTVVITHSFRVACEDANVDQPASTTNVCESPKLAVSLTVVRAPAAPTMTLDLDNTVAGTDGSVTNGMNICQGPNNMTVINSNCPTLIGWQTQWQIIGEFATQGTGATWSGNAPATNDAGINNDNNILLVNATNFNSANTSASFGWTIKARCFNGNIPADCTTGATTEYTNIVVRQKELPQTFRMEFPAGTIIPSGENLCLGSTIKLVQTTIGNICTGTLQWQRRFRPTVGVGSFGSWSIVIDEQTSPIPYTNTPDAVGEYEYQIRCNGTCPSSWSASQSVVISETPTPGFTASPLTTACVEPSSTKTIELSLSGCNAINSNGGPVFSKLYRVSRVMTQEGVVGSTTTTFDVPADNLGDTSPKPYWDNSVFNTVITASANNSTTRTYVFTVTCVRVYGPGPQNAPTNSVECIGTPVSQTVTIRTKPAAPTALVVNATPICVDGTATLTGTCAEGTIEWDQITNVLTAGTPKNYSGSPFVITNVPSSVSYRARCVVGDCAGHYAAQQVSVQVVVPAKPVLSQTAPTICATPSIGPSVKRTKLSATGCSGSQETLVWSGPGITNDNKNGVNAGLNTPYELWVTTGSALINEAHIESEMGGQYVYTATCTRPGVCVSTETITVTVLKNPELYILKAPTTDPVCAGTAVTLTAKDNTNPSGFVSMYSWVGSGSLVTSANQNDPAITTPGGGAVGGIGGTSGTYYFTAQYQSCVFQSPSVTVNVVNQVTAPVKNAGSDDLTKEYCKATKDKVTLVVNACAVGTTVWSTGAADDGKTTIQADVPGSGSATYTVKCVLGACESPLTSFTVNTRPFDITILDIQKSEKNVLSAAESVYPHSVYSGLSSNGSHGGQLDIYKTTSANRLNLINYFTPRFWTIEAKLCAANPAVKSLTFRADKLDAVDNVEVQFYTTEDSDRYFMFANGGNTPADEVFTINHPYFAYYQGGIYNAGFPKGKYNIRVDAWDKPGDTQGGTLLSNVQKIAPWNPVHSGFPSTNLLSRTYYIDIQSSAARVGVEEGEEAFAVVTPNPVTRTLTLSINGAKGQNVSLNLVDASGRSLMTRSVTPESNSHREEVDMSNNKTGMYFMQVTSPSRNAALKVLKVSQD